MVVNPNEGTRSRVAFESARLRLSRLHQDCDAACASTMRNAARISAVALRVARVSVWMLRDGGTALECQDVYTTSGEATEKGLRVLASDCPAYFAAMLERRTIVAHHARTDPATRELTAAYLEPHGITSMLDAPIIRGGEVVGIVCHEHVGAPREWSQEDMAFSASVADMLTITLEQTERFRLEAKSRHETARRGLQTKMEALGRLAGAIAHDFNNVTCTIGLLAHGLTTNRDRNVAQVGLDIVSSVDVARRLTRQLPAFGKDRPVASVRVDLVALLDRFRPVLETAMGSNVKLALEMTSSVPTVMADPSMIEQLVLNLCMNARDAIDADTGRVDVRVRDPRADDLLERVDVPFVILEVMDDGQGMDEATQERIFEPYFTTRAEGTGLGLATVYDIVEKLDGFIGVASEPGKGSTFTVALPRVAS
jgi:two-component system, cell cycle sensor histidine kinase and response regulator CckA